MLKTIFMSILLLIFSHTLYADDYLDSFIKNKSNDSGQLLVTKPLDFNNLKSIIYVQSNQKFSKKFKVFFRKYAKNLGLKHGALILKIQDPQYSEYLKASYCDTEIFSNNKIIIELRDKKECYTFNIFNNQQQYYNLLLKVEKNIDDHKSLLKEYSKSKLREVVYTSDSQLAKNFIDEITTLFDLLLKYFKI